MTHKFTISAGDFECSGEIEGTPGGFIYYTYDSKIKPTKHLDESLSEAIYKIGAFLQANGSLKEFTITSL